MNKKNFKIYAVGGQVRDGLLNRPISDKDYLVVGATIKDMLDLGYKQVGKDFPVFLHPITGDEYALARTERKIGDKHTDFVFDFNPEITLKEDLSRRDFTINAIAKDLDTGEFIDPFNGIYHLKNELLQHINNSFKTDPLRVLRACRFAAQLDFMIAEPTIRLCRQMSMLGMLQHLTEERVWKEIEKALHTNNFALFLHYLSCCNAIQIILPEFAILDRIEEPLTYHPEGNTYAHTLLTLKQVDKYKLQGKDLALVNFGLLCHDLGKQLSENPPKHPGHDMLGIELVDKLCDRLKVPNVYREFGKISCKYHMKFYNFLSMNIKTQYDMIKEITKFKDDHNLALLQKVHVCDFLGRAKRRTDAEVDKVLKTISRQNLIFNIMKDVTLEDLPTDVQENLSHYQGEKFGKLYRDAMISYLKHKLNERG